MTDGAPRPEPGASLGDDDRGVSVTLGYTLTLSITAVLVAGLLTAGGGLIEGQQRTVAADGLSVSGQQLAAGFEDADRLAATTDTGTVRVNVWLPDSVAGGRYTLTIRNESNQANQPALTTIVAKAENMEVTRNVSLRTENPVANRTLRGGPVTIRYNDSDGDGTRELVVVERRSIALNQPEPAAFGHEEIVYVDAPTGELRSVTPGGEVTRYGVTAAAIGPKQVDLDDDGLREVPYVTAANELRIVDAEGETETLATDAAASPGNDTSLIAVGEWNNVTSVFYLNNADTVGGNPSIYRVSTDTAPQQVTVDGSGIDAMAIAGIGDMNEDNDTDLVYIAGGTEQARYLDDGTETNLTTVGTDPGYGVGDPREFNDGERDGMPFVDASGDVRIYRGTASSTIATGAAKTSVAGIDWVDGGSLEVVYVDAADGTIKYVQIGGDSTVISGNITVDEDKGVA